MEFIHLPIPLEVVVRRNDGPGSRRMRLCQISYAFHPEASFGAIARAESGACAFGDCLFDVGRCSTRPWYTLSATSQCGAALTGASQQGDPCADRSIRPDAVLRSGGDSSRADDASREIPCLKALLGTLGCRGPSAPTTASPSPVAVPSSA